MLGGLVRARSLGLRFTSSEPPAPEALPSFFSPPASEMAKPFYVTTPIFYVNASPHIGHLHSVVLTDVFARFSRLRHPDRPVVFSTGTDEHGLKIQQAAARAGISEHAFCDDVSQRFRDLAVRANISHTDFIRTSEERHYRAVEAFWAKLVATGNVYKGTHEGWYSVSDESFFSAKQVEKRDGKMIATETGNEVTWETEENWKFRLDAYKPQLEAWLANPECELCAEILLADPSRDAGALPHRDRKGGRGRRRALHLPPLEPRQVGCPCAGR
jgi:methionyl-tRNA synthetase